MEKPRAWVWVIAVVTVLLSLVCSTMAGAFAGGLAGFIAGRWTVVSGWDGSGPTLRQYQRDWQWEWNPQEGLPWPVQPDVPEVEPQPPQRQPQLQQGVVGAWVQQVVPGSPAEECGLQEGDIILAVNDERVGRRLLSDVIGQYKPGDAVRLVVQRGEQRLDLKVRLGENPEDAARGYLGVYVVPYGVPELPGQ